MICKRCGAALPNSGVVCMQCGAMMSKEQIEEQKKWQEINKQTNNVQLMSEKYKSNKENFKSSRSVLMRRKGSFRMLQKSSRSMRCREA